MAKLRTCCTFIRIRSNLLLRSLSLNSNWTLLPSSSILKLSPFWPTEGRCNHGAIRSKLESKLKVKVAEELKVEVEVEEEMGNEEWKWRQKRNWIRLLNLYLNQIDQCCWFARSRDSIQVYLCWRKSSDPFAASNLMLTNFAVSHKSAYP